MWRPRGGGEKETWGDLGRTHIPGWGHGQCKGPGVGVGVFWGLSFLGGNKGLREAWAGARRAASPF